MSDRTRQILARLPAHLEAARPGKQFSVVAGALAAPLDLLSAGTAAVRRAHRLGHADTLTDLLHLGGLHGLGRADLGVLLSRADRVRDWAAKLSQAAGRSAEDRDRWAAALLDLWGVAGGESRLRLFAPVPAQGSEPDLDTAAENLAGGVRALVTYRSVVGAARTRIQRICRIHAAGNGTVRALLEGAANVLDLEVDVARNATVKASLTSSGADATLHHDIPDEFFHSRDRFWHATYVQDRTPLTRLVPTPVPGALVRMGDAIPVSELADRMSLRTTEVLTRMIELGVTGVRPDTPLDLDTAERVGAAFGVTVERVLRGTVRMGATIGVQELARQLGSRPADLLARLAPLGAGDLAADSPVSPDLAARVARRDGYQIAQTLAVAPEVLGIEENPLRREISPTVACTHGHRFRILRRGFDRTLLQIRLGGRENLTAGPMLANRDEGCGVGYFGAVPAGQTLTFMEEGRAYLDGRDVTAFAFSWRGACFADQAEPDPDDFVLDGPGVEARRRAVFAVATPEGALDRDAVFPHAGLSVPMPGIGIGETRLAFFLQVAHLSSRDGQAEASVIRRVAPHPVIGFVDQSVFGAAQDADFPAAADVTLSWLEHEAYALRVIIPRRFALLDGNPPFVTDRVRHALERFRPAGVQVRVEYLDEQWQLGRGFLLEELGDEDPILRLRGGTALWPPPTNGR